MTFGGLLVTCDEAGIAKPTWPAEVDRLIALVEAGVGKKCERRLFERRRLRLRAVLEHSSDPTNAQAANSVIYIYTRDISAGGVGFLTKDPLKLGRRARVHLPGPRDTMRCVEAVVARSTTLNDGWYDAAIRFQAAQHPFE